MNTTSIRLKTKYNIVLEKLLANLFFLLFSAQILSPFILGRTFYLEFFIALCNPFFLLWINKKTKKIWILWFLMFFVIVGILLKFVLLLKLFFICITVLFLFYSYEQGMFYLYRYACVSVIFSIIQFAFLFIDPSISLMFGPDNISESIWGAYSTKSWSNFYTIFFIPRVSGLAREAGFFASFLVCVIFIYRQQRLLNDIKKNKILTYFLLIGFVLSFSKMSIILLLVVAVSYMRKLIDRIPLLLIVGLFVVCMIVLWSNLDSILFDIRNSSLVHRFAGYPTLLDLNSIQLLFGEIDLSDISSRYAKLLVDSNFDRAAGFSGFFIENGLIFSLIFFVFLWLLGCSSTGCLLLLLFTINVDVTTNQNFVVLSYFLIFKFFNSHTCLFSSKPINV